MASPCKPLQSPSPREICLENDGQSYLDFCRLSNRCVCHNCGLGNGSSKQNRDVHPAAAPVLTSIPISTIPIFRAPRAGEIYSPTWFCVRHAQPTRLIWQGETKMEYRI